MSSLFPARYPSAFPSWKREFPVREEEEETQEEPNFMRVRKLSSLERVAKERNGSGWEKRRRDR